jgi:hypothetical protein
LLAETASPPSFVSLIQNHRSVFQFEQILTFTGVMDNQAGGDDGDAVRTAGNIFSAARFDGMPFEVKPNLFV